MMSMVAPVAVCCPFGAVKVGPGVMQQLAEIQVLVVKTVAHLMFAMRGQRSFVALAWTCQLLLRLPAS